MIDFNLPILSIITVHFKTEEKIARLCQSLQKFPPHILWEHIIVDNHSNTPQWGQLKKTIETFPHTHIVELGSNMGFGRGNDEGLKFAKGKYIVFLNPDIQISSSGTFESLLETLQQYPQAGIVTPRLTSIQGTILSNTWEFPSFWSLLKKRLQKTQKTQPEPQIPFAVDWAQGSFLVLRRDLYDEIGGFDHRFFLFLEDTDLCRRVWEKGLKVIKVPTVVAIHEEKRLSGEDLFQSMMKKTFWIHVSSALKYFWKWR